MVNWKTASTGDQKRLNAISMILKRYPWLIDQIFHPTDACLRTSAQALMRGRSGGEKILIGAALDVWNESGNARVADLCSLDDENFQNVLSALSYLRTA